jgi:hypothetical protein
MLDTGAFPQSLETRSCVAGSGRPQTPSCSPTTSAPRPRAPGGGEPVSLESAVVIVHRPSRDTAQVAPTSGHTPGGEMGEQEPGPPPLPCEVKKLIVRFANDNPRWGSQRIRVLPPSCRWDPPQGRSAGLRD